MTTTTQHQTSEAGIRTAEITMSVIAGALVGGVLAAVIPLTLSSLIIGVPAAIIVAFGVDALVRTVRRGYLSD